MAFGDLDFKGLAEEMGLPYQKLIDLYLLDCAKKRKEAGNEVGSVAVSREAISGDSERQFEWVDTI